MQTVRVRVAVYVTRDGAAGPELLVFDHRDHPAAGTQVPAGGVAPGEDPAAAALREVAEETGLADVVLGRRLGVQRSPHPATGRPRETTFWHATTGERRPGWRHAVDGAGDDAGLVFDCSFVPLSTAAGRLTDGQDEFLGALLARRLGECGDGDGPRTATGR